MQPQSVRMIAYFLYFLLLQFGFLLTENAPQKTDDTLILLHVLFRHGNRTPNGPEEVYPKDPYLNETYFPVGFGKLTNAGKRREYLIGKALRKRYDKFLGPHYHSDLVEAWSTDYNRTKMSLEFVFAGLYPPHTEVILDEELPWEPVSYNYYKRSEDNVLLGVDCPNYLKLYEAQLHSRKFRPSLNRYKKIFDYISENTGLKIERFLDVYNLYFGLSTEEEWGFKLPEWTKKVWPKIITDLTIQEYLFATSSTKLKQFTSGYLLGKILTDTQKKIINNSDKKIYLYSAHENNIAELLNVLEIFKPLHIPNYGAYVIFEVHKIGGKYGIKIYYENYIEDAPKLMKLPFCGIFCEISKFTALIEDYIPTIDITCGGSNTTEVLKDVPRRFIQDFLYE